MHKFSSLAFAAALTLALAGCSHRKSADDADDGHILSVDKDTGVVTVMDDNKIVKVKTPQEQAAEDRENEALANPQSMPSLDVPAAGGKAQLVIFWRDDQLQYTFSMSSDSAELQRARANPQASFEILLRGADGSLVKSVAVPASSLQAAKAGKPAGLSKDGSAPCSSDDYRRITTWDLTWRGLETE